MISDETEKRIAEVLDAFDARFVSGNDEYDAGADAIDVLRLVMRKALARTAAPSPSPEKPPATQSNATFTQEMNALLYPLPATPTPPPVYSPEELRHDHGLKNWRENTSSPEESRVVEQPRSDAPEAEWRRYQVLELMREIRRLEDVQIERGSQLRSSEDRVATLIKECEWERALKDALLESQDRLGAQVAQLEAFLSRAKDDADAERNSRITLQLWRSSLAEKVEALPMRDVITKTPASTTYVMHIERAAVLRLLSSPSSTEP